MPRQSIFVQIPQAAQRTFIVRPAFLHLDPEFEVDLAVQQGFDLGTRLPTDLLEHPPLPADDDCLLALPLDPDQGMDVNVWELRWDIKTPIPKSFALNSKA